MCCSSAAWKREVVPDHKFDFINVHEFHSTGFGTRLQYLWLWILFIISVAVYIADIYTAVALLASNKWSATILQSEAAQGSSKSANVLEVPFSIGKWVFTGCIIFSFLLLAWEARKSRAIIKSRDISYAYTNVLSQNWYALRSFDHFCFFCQIDDSKKKKDGLATFVFFTFKGWKRLLLADAPRQVINAITLYSFGKSENWTTDLSVYFGGGILKSGVIITMLFTLVVWVGSAILLIVAAVLYVPLLCYIQGNLKEYVCHKVDKRIAELMKRKNRKRMAKEAELARKEAQGDYSHLKDKKTGKLTAAPLPQPTLPKLGLSDQDLYTGSDAGSIRGGAYGYPPPASSFSGGAMYNPSALSRNAYQYASSDSESVIGGGGGGGGGGYPYQQHHPNGSRGGGGGGYAESVTSVDGFANRGGPMGWDSSVSLVGRGAGGGVGMQRAPSYRSDGGGVGGDEKGWRDDEKNWGGGGAPLPPSLVPSLSYGGGGGEDGRSYVGNGLGAGLARSGSTAPTNISSAEPYSAPSRAQLYERAARQTAGSRGESIESGLGYARGDSINESSVYGHAQAGSYNGGSSVAGWEASGPRWPVPNQQGGGGGRGEYLDRSVSERWTPGEESGNFAGRGAGGRR